MTPRWQALIVDGQFSQKLRDKIVHASGAYAIREKKGHKVVYVGESRRGVMWKTLLRHFHAPESFRKTRQRGIFTTRLPSSYEVAVWVTGKGHRPRGKSEPDQKAMAAQAEWIKRLRPSHNDDDGMAYDDDFSLPDEPDDPWYGLGVSNPGKRWDNAKTAEKYGLDRGVVKQIYEATKEAKAQGLHGGPTVDLLELRVGRKLFGNEYSVASEARAHLQFDPPPGYGGPKPKGVPSRDLIDRQRSEEAERIEWSVMREKNRVEDAHKEDQSWNRLTDKELATLRNVAETWEVAADVYEEAGRKVTAGTLRQRAAFARAGDLARLWVYNPAKRFDLKEFVRAEKKAAREAIASLKDQLQRSAALRFSEPPVQKHQRLQKVALRDIEPERPWSEDKLAALRSKYAKGDLLEPVRLMRGESGKWAIVDGNHRVALVRELGESHVLAVVDREANPGRKGCVELGKLTRIAWKGGSRAWSLERAPSLVYTPQGRLLIVYDAQPTRAKAPLAALASYVRKHWGSLPSSARLSEGDVAKAPFVVLGEGVDITYTTRKDGRKLVDYVHCWGDTVDGVDPGFAPPVVEKHACGKAGCASEGRLALRGGTYRVTDHGIVG